MPNARLTQLEDSEAEISIRELQSSDLDHGFLEALAALTEVDLTPEAARSIFADLPANSRTFVAEIDGRIVGTATLLIERKFIHGGGKVGHIEDVAVHRAFQRRGIGTLLVEHAARAAEVAGCYKVILDCFDPLVPFYERLGFHPFNRSLRRDLSGRQ